MLGERCSHGKTWGESCPECDLVAAREFVQRWGPMVDEARERIAAAESKLVPMSTEAFDAALDLTFQAIGAISRHIGPECVRKVREATGIDLAAKSSCEVKI